MNIKKMSARTASALVCLSVAVMVIAIALFSPFADAAGGYLKWRDLSPDVRTRAYVIPVETFGTGTGSTIGSGGVLSAQVLETYCDTTNCGPFIQTSSISTFVWPQRLFVRLVDGGAGDTLTCTSADIHGRDQFGTPKMETVLTITEAGEYTNTVFESVSRVVGRGCGEAGGITGTDVLTVQAPTTYLGMRGVFTDEDDFVSACLKDVSGDLVLCAELNDGGSADLQSAISVAKSCGPSANERCFYVDVSLSNLWQTVTPAADDEIHIQFRPRR